MSSAGVDCRALSLKVIIPNFLIKVTARIRSTRLRIGATPMLTHNQIWTALDRLAAQAGLSPSALAKRAGLDPTTFNKSKRVTSDGRERWPSTESVSKALAATGMTIHTFVQLIDETTRGVQSVPLLSFAEAGASGRFDQNGLPIGDGWDEAGFPSVSDQHAYALEISGDAMKPAYRDGDIIVVSPAAPVRRGDRVVLKARNGEIMLKELRRRTAKTIELQSVDPGHSERTLAISDVEWIARIVWASQ